MTSHEYSSDGVTGSSRSQVTDRSSGRVTQSSSATGRACAWCHSPLEVTAPPFARFCGHKCRQAAWRLRIRRQIAVSHSSRMRMAYADPPYPGMSAKYYRDEATFAGEVDHKALIASLEASGYDGWALSTSSKSLRDVLPLCPPGVRVCAWVKPIGIPKATNGLHSTWEPLIVCRGRQQQPGVRDFLIAQPARFGGSLPGRKPPTFVAWLFDCLGLQVGDELDDLFPGTGIVGRAWASLTARADASPGDGGHASRRYRGDERVSQVLGDESSQQESL